MTVQPERAETARALMLEIFPEGFEEQDAADGLELAAYTDAGGEERLWHAFGGIRRTHVAGDWAERWRDFHRPIRIGRLWVGPPWESPPSDALAVVIDPGRAFGTGSHPTTRLCLELLLDEGRTSLVDVGCGSGVLSIAALRLGFSPVVALDVDPQAVEATRLNAAVNGVTLDVRGGDAFAELLPQAGLTVANITLEAVGRLAPLVCSERLVTSGYLASENPLLPGLERVERREQEGWAADLFARERK